jgi:hypothetical protein
VIADDELELGAPERLDPTLRVDFLDRELVAGLFLRAVGALPPVIGRSAPMTISRVWDCACSSPRLAQNRSAASALARVKYRRIRTVRIDMISPIVTTGGVFLASRQRRPG